jgi:putative N6-adenine-specific DNA methylase
VTAGGWNDELKDLMDQGALENQKIVVTCLPRMSEVLRAELQSMGMPVVKVEEKAVTTKGSLRDVMLLNFTLRTASRVLLHIRTFQASHPKQVYKKLKSIPWEGTLPVGGYFSVDSYVSNPFIRDTRYANLIVKDAVVDRLQERVGKRPDTGSEKKHAVIFLYWYNHQCEVYFDTSGEALSRRGYRENPWKAPLQENLAAALILASQWKPGMPFVNPMCGSGTLAIEAAMMAASKYPGHLRSNYGFMHLKSYDPAQWRTLVEQHREKIPAEHTKIIATDHNAQAIRAARANARNAGVDQYIEFQRCDFSKTRVPPPAGVVMLNPEYGERLGFEEQLQPQYTAMGDFLKTRCVGYWGYIFTGNLPLAKKIGLRTKRRLPFYNAKIDCRLLEFELYKGTRKEGSGQ